MSRLIVGPFLKISWGLVEGDEQGKTGTRTQAGVGCRAVERVTRKVVFLASLKPKLRRLSADHVLHLRWP